MEQVGESQKRKKLRFSWKSEEVGKKFLEACIHEVEENGPKAGSHAFTWPKFWRKLAERLKDSHNLVLGQRQMKNHYDHLKARYKAWVKLKNKYEGVYDPLTNTFNLTEEEWRIERKGNKHIESLMSTPLLFPKLCAQLFDGPLASDYESDGSSSETQETLTSKPSCSSHAEVQRPTKKAKVSETSNISGIEKDTYKALESLKNAPIVFPKLCAQPFNGPLASDDESGVSSSKAQEISTSVQRPTKNSNVSGIEEDIYAALQLVINRNEGPSFKDCRDKLRELGWVAKNPLYKMALVIFCEGATYRDAWMQLQVDEVEDWVRMVGRKLRLVPG